VVIRAAKKDDRLCRWIYKIRMERGFNKAIVALTSKIARTGWAVLANKAGYQIAWRIFETPREVERGNPPTIAKTL